MNQAIIIQPDSKAGNEQNYLLKKTYEIQKCSETANISYIGNGRSEQGKKAVYSGNMGYRLQCLKNPLA
jgi:hypothetical protein